MHPVNDLTQLLEATLEEQLATGCPGAILEVSAPDLGIAFSGARGLYARDGARHLQVTDAFRAASITKAVTAATAVHLAANHHWDLDDPAAKFLPAQIVLELSRLKGLSDVNQLTIRRLLSHTSGLPDYFFDDRFQQAVRREPDRVWQPEELVGAAVDIGELLFTPGSDFSYGDTGYVVVGIAIERRFDCCLADAYRSVVLDPLAMGSTYVEWREPPRHDSLSHHYDRDEDLRPRNLSFDWAGGGLVTTASDLTRFLKGLFGGVLFSRCWLNEMTDWRTETRWRPHSSARYSRYGLGLGMNFAYGEEIVGATGVWGAFAYYWPSGGATVTGTLNVVGADRPALMDRVIWALKRRPTIGERI